MHMFYCLLTWRIQLIIVLLGASCKAILSHCCRCNTDWFRFEYFSLPFSEKTCTNREWKLSDCVTRGDTWAKAMLDDRNRFIHLWIAIIVRCTCGCNFQANFTLFRHLLVAKFVYEKKKKRREKWALRCACVEIEWRFAYYLIDITVW